MCLHQIEKIVAFPWVVTSTGPGGFMALCVYYMTGTPEGSTESGFMENPGNEPANPGFSRKGFIPYTKYDTGP